MSDLAEFQALSNKELHKKVLEYGLPNMPVTDSSRNVLIKKLVAAKNSKTVPGATAAAAQKRRETLHTTSTTTPTKAAATDNAASSPASTSRRRRTVNANVATARADVDDSDGHVVVVEKAQKPQNTPTAARQYTRRPLEAQSLSKSAVVSTSHDQSFGGPQSRAPSRHARNSRDSETESVNSNRSSVSLSRSEIVTTSYRQEIAPLPRRLDESYAYDEEEEEDDDEEPMDVDDYYMGGNLSGSSSNRTQHITPLYTESNELIPGPFQQQHIGHNSTADGYDISYESTRGLYNEPSPTQPFDYTKSNLPMKPNNNMRNVTPSYTTKRYTNIGHTTASADEYDTIPTTRPQQPRRHTTTNFPKPTIPESPPSPANILYPSLNDFYATPMASSSQRLTDEAELIDSTESEEECIVPPVDRRYTHGLERPVGPPTGRRPTVLHEHDGGVETSLVAFLEALDKKYSLRQLFFILLCAVLAILVYTFFLS